jgi:hypothetical protein
MNSSDLTGAQRRSSSGVASRDPPGKLAAGHENKIQKQLDEALEDSFPASDPVSIVTSQEEEDWGEGETAPPPAPSLPKEGPTER